MNKILLTFALLLATTTANAGEWKASCKSKYSNWFGTYTFEVDKGEVGGCKSDKIKQQYATTGWDWSERAEVMSTNHNKFGQFEWSATIDIDRNCKPAERNTLFQVHAGGYLVTPPSWIGINRYNKFRTNERGGGTNVTVPNRPFKLTAKINATKKDVKVDYFIDDNFLISTHGHAMGDGYTKIYFKFGVYRVNSNCTIKQTYTNIKLKRVK